MTVLTTNLESLSPLSFDQLKVGDNLLLKIKKPNKAEFRGSIGAAVKTILVFRGQMKVGMLPLKFVAQSQEMLRGKISCKVSEVSREKKKIVVEIMRLD